MLGINLKLGKNEDVVKWFLAAILYSKPIREESATRTYRCFERHGVITVKRILNAGWDRLVSILDEGGYTRYDFSTATKLLAVFGNLEERYGGDLTKLYRASADEAELETNLKKLGKGIGDTTVSIFLRDMVHVEKGRSQTDSTGDDGVEEIGYQGSQAVCREASYRHCPTGDSAGSILKGLLEEGEAIEDSCLSVGQTAIWSTRASCTQLAVRMWAPA